MLYKGEQRLLKVYIYIYKYHTFLPPPLTGGVGGTRALAFLLSEDAPYLSVTTSHIERMLFRRTSPNFPHKHHTKPHIDTDAVLLRGNQ